MSRWLARVCRFGLGRPSFVPSQQFRDLGLTLRETDRRLLADLLSEHDTLSRRVDDFDQHLDEALAPWAEQLRLLETLPGIDHAAACAILSETGADPHRVFGNAHRLAAWAGLCPGNNESAGKRRTGRTRRGTGHAGQPHQARCGPFIFDADP